MSSSHPTTSHSTASSVSFDLNSTSNISFSNSINSSFESDLLKYHLSSSLPSPKYQFMFDTPLPEAYNYDNFRGSTSLSTPVTTVPSLHSSQSITDKVQIFNNYYNIGSNKLVTNNDDTKSVDTAGLYGGTTSNSNIFTRLKVDTNLKDENLTRINSSHSFYPADLLSSRSMTPSSPAAADFNIYNRTQFHHVGQSNTQPSRDPLLDGTSNIQYNNDIQFDLKVFQTQVDKILSNSINNALNNFSNQLDVILNNKLALFNNEINKSLDSKRNVNKIHHSSGTSAGISQGNNNIAASLVLPNSSDPAVISQIMNTFMGANFADTKLKYPSTSSVKVVPEVKANTINPSKDAVSKNNVTIKPDIKFKVKDPIHSAFLPTNFSNEVKKT